MILACPFSLIAYRASAYMRDVFHALEDPGVPIELKYRAGTGEVLTLRADRYVLSIKDGFVRVDAPRLLDPKGELVAGLKYVEARNLNIRNLGDQVIHVRASGLTARVKRLPSGELNVAKFLPEKKGPPSTIPFDVSLSNAHAVFVDEMGPVPWSQTLSADEVRVTGLGDDWMAKTRVAIKGIGTFPLEVEKITGFGIEAKTTTDGAELAPVWAHLSQTPPFAKTEYAGAKASSIRVDGPIRVFLPEAKEGETVAPLAETRLSVRVRNVRFREYALDSAAFAGLVTEKGAAGKASATLGPNRLAFNGSVVWDKGLQGAGDARADSPSLASLPAWIRKQVPDSVAYNDADFSGWVAFRSANDYRISGDVHAKSLIAQGEKVQDLNAGVRYSPGELTANVRQVVFQGKPTSGAFTLNTKNQALSGAIQAKKLDLSILAKRFKVKGLTGRGDVLASLGGTIGHPALNVSSQGTVAYSQDGRKLSGRYDISGSYANDAIKLSRGLLRGSFGLISASGAIGKKGDLGIKIIGRDLNPEVVDSRVAGQANVIALVTGTAAKPLVTGYVEAYNVAVENYLVPAISAQFTANRNSVSASEVRATHGTTELTGKGAYVYKNGGVSGQIGVRGVELADFVGEGFAGLIDIPDAKIGGTISHPTLEANLVGRNVVVKDLKVDAVSAHLTSDGFIAKVESASAEVAGGTISATAQYDIDKGEGLAQVTARKIALADVTPKVSTAVSTSGQVGGMAEIKFTSKGLTSVDAGGQMRDIVLNDTQMGNGPWALTYDGQKFNGNMQVGLLERYVSVDKATYDPETRQLSGGVSLFNSDVQDLVAIGTRYLTNLSPSVLASLHTAKGHVNVGASVSGSIDKPKVDVSTLDGSALEYEGVALGNLAGQATVDGTLLTLQQFDLTGGALVANIKGRADTEGDVDVTVDLSTPLLASLAPIVPQLANNGGDAQMLFDATGPIQNPDLHFSLIASKLFTTPAPPEETEAQKKLRLQREAEALRFSLTGEVSGSEKVASIGGDYFYRGFQGKIDAQAPVDYKKGITADGKVVASVTVAERSLSEIAQFLPNLDAKQTTGMVSGRIDASGSPNNLVLTGGLNLKADMLALVVPKTNLTPGSGPPPAPNTIDDKLKNVDVSVKLNGDTVALHASAESSRGGSVDANVSTPIGELQTLVSTLRDTGLSDLMDNPLTGTVKLNKLSARQSFPTPSNPDDAFAGLLGGFVGATADGEITIAGTVSEPKIEGKIALSDVDSEIPTIVGGSGESAPPAINPAFDLRVTLAEPANIRTTAATLAVLGGGRLTGTLASPSIRSSLQVESGSITLPAATVRVEQGGTVAFNYEPAPDGAIARLDVDMEGRTAVTAQRYGDVYERYDITLVVKGDLLKEGGLNLSASSDPPDLSQDRILALLGQVDLISTVATSGFGQSDTERRLRDALTGFALPALTSNLTNKLARGIGFEYLTIEYNGFEQASLAFGKALGSGFSIQGRRQVGEPTPGFKPLYDLRLVYRPRRVRGVLSRFSFSIGADQDRPFKAAIEYGFRF